MTKQINVGIIGVGTVGGGAARILVENSKLITSRATSIVLKKICDRDEAILAKRVEELGLASDMTTTDAYEIINDENIDIVVELIGGTTIAYDFITAAMKNGKSVITANKDLVATKGNELFAIADENKVDFYFEAAVAGGIPIIRTIRESLQANNIKQIMGIVNGTTNYILSEMTETGADFAPTLKQAQDLGYAESDPTSDVEGLDAARKMAILASLAFDTRVTYDMVYVEGITKITKYDIDYAKELNYVIKLLGIAKSCEENYEVHVHPVFVPKEHPLASVNDAYNAVFIEGDALGNAMFYGRGAGDLPTGSAVISDVIIAAKNIINDTRGINGCTCFTDKTLKEMKDVIGKYYARLMVNDQPSVLAQIATAFGSNGVSLDAVVQKRITNSGLAELVVITHSITDAQMAASIKSLSELSCVDSIASTIRVID